MAAITTWLNALPAKIAVPRRLTAPRSAIKPLSVAPAYAKVVPLVNVTCNGASPSLLTARSVVGEPRGGTLLPAKRPLSCPYKHWRVPSDFYYKVRRILKPLCRSLPTVNGNLVSSLVERLLRRTLSLLSQSLTELLTAATILPCPHVPKRGRAPSAALRTGPFLSRYPSDFARKNKNDSSCFVPLVASVFVPPRPVVATAIAVARGRVGVTRRSSSETRFQHAFSCYP